MSKNRFKSLAIRFAATSALSFGGAALAEEHIIPDACQETKPSANFAGKFGGEASCDDIPNAPWCCEINSLSTDQENPSSCSAVVGGKTLEIEAFFIADPAPEGVRPGMKFSVVQGPDKVGGVDQTVWKGTTGGSLCVHSWSKDVKVAEGVAFANKQGNISPPQKVLFFADEIEDPTPRFASKFIPDCRELEILAPAPGPDGTPIGATLTGGFCPPGAPGVNQLLINVLEVRDNDGKRIPFFGQQIGDTISDSDIDTTNYCVCNFLPVQPDEIAGAAESGYYRDYACDEFTEPGEFNEQTQEYGCEITTDDPALRVWGGLQSQNPSCSRWGSNRCY